MQRRPTSRRMPQPTLTLVMPTIGWAEPFATCLRAALNGLEPGDEALVVFDGAPPPRPEWLQQNGIRLLATGIRSGPAAARNLAAREARGEILLFVDADVQVHPDAIDRIRERFAADRDLAAVFGSYDDTPAAPGLVSRFRNLLHHHTHNSHPGPASTFWAGCGAVRRDRFLALGGFDAETYRKPCIEDIEFGLRLHDEGGRILLDPTIEGTHHKCWSLGLMVRTDIHQRAIPWSQLLLSRRQVPATLNLSTSARLSAGLSLLLPGALLLSLTNPMVQPWALLALVGGLTLWLLLNRAFLALLWRQGGLRLAAAGTGLLMLYLLYSSLSFAAVSLTAMASAPVRTPGWLQGRPDRQRRLAWAGLTLLALIALLAILHGLIVLGMTHGGHDLGERFDEWRLFRDGIYPSGHLADPAARSLPYFRTTVYLPWALPLFGGLFSWGGFGQGKLLISTGSLAALALMAGIGRRTLMALGRQASWLGMLTPLLILGNSTGLKLGQFSLICMGLISLQWWLLDRRRPVAAGLCWALAMLKPQIALPFALPLLQRWNRIGLVAGSGLLLTLATVALAHTRTGPAALTASWLQVLPSFQGNNSVNALAALWPLLTNPGGTALAVSLVIGIGLAQRERLLGWWARRKFLSRSGSSFHTDPLELAGFCGVVALVGFYHRNYDHILLFPALLVLWRTTLQQPRWGNLLLTLSMALSVWIPQTVLNTIPNIASVQAMIWSVGGAWLLLRLLDRSKSPAAMVTELRPTG